MLYDWIKLIFSLDFIDWWTIVQSKLSIFWHILLRAWSNRLKVWRCWRHRCVCLKIGGSPSKTIFSESNLLWMKQQTTWTGDGNRLRPTWPILPVSWLQIRRWLAESFWKHGCLVNQSLQNRTEIKFYSNACAWIRRRPSLNGHLLMHTLDFKVSEII